MKPISKLFWTAAMFSLSVLFSGCDLLDKAGDVTFDAVVEADWNADENADGTDVPYNDTRTIDLSGNAEIAKYINKIKEVVPWFKSSYMLRMDDRKQTEVPVSRAQTKRLRELFKL